VGILVENGAAVKLAPMKSTDFYRQILGLN